MACPGPPRQEPDEHDRRARAPARRHRRPGRPGAGPHAGHRGRLFAVAYRLLGSVADAEDVVQDVAEVWTRTDRRAIDDPQAWLVTVTTRRCLDRLRSARHRRERHVGPWLPEPLVTDVTSTGTDPASEAEHPPSSDAPHASCATTQPPAGSSLPQPCSPWESGA
ncbi:hypothetical protein FTX61_04945 [Nitriliruptoraceae bacterium ZYF776]|nr:hypothetical protein [Profundirhabdus halotolerans]